MLGWITDPKTNQKSVTLTFLAWGLGCAFLIANIKILLSGNIALGLNWDTFTGSDYALVVGAPATALGALYRWRKKDSIKGEEDGS